MPEHRVNQSTSGISFSSVLVIILGILLSGFYFTRGPTHGYLNVPNAVDLKEEYDFIVVGAGSAGSVVANRLSENPNFKVLLLEAGGDETETSETPVLAPFLQMTELDWNYTIQTNSKFCLGMVGKSCSYPRGRVLGGSSVLNYMMYVRGNKKDFDNWAEAGNYGWSYEEVLPYFKKSEDNRNPAFAKNEKYHSNNGELTVSDQGWQTSLADIFLKAGEELGYDIGDYNGENQNVFSKSQITVRDGSRCSTSKAFLHPSAVRKNLHIAKHAYVTKILIDPETKRAYGVRFFRNGANHDVIAKKEIIMSAGAFNTPHLLMLSGIGPKDHLEQLDIPVIKDLPVGLNLQNHFGYPMSFLSDKHLGFSTEKLTSIYSYLSYVLFRQGPLTNPAGAEAIAFVNSKYQNPKDLQPDLQLFSFASSAAHDGGLTKKIFRMSDELVETMFLPLSSKEDFQMLVILQRPKSTGKVYLKSKNPFDLPIINENYFNNEDDNKRLIDGGRIALKLIETKSFQGIKAKYHYVPIPTCPNAAPLSDEYFECLMRYNTMHIYHASGTAKMGPKDGPTSVVDPELRVLGISGLRVVDASAMPKIVSGNINAATIMIGEKGSDMIKKSWAH